MENNVENLVVTEVRSIIAICDQLIHEEQFEKLSEYYTEDAVLVVKPDLKVVGRAAISRAFAKIAAYFDNSLKPVEGKMEFLIAGDTVLVLAQTFIEANQKATAESDYSLDRRATYVFRKVNDQWLCAIDNSYGTSLLD